MACVLPWKVLSWTRMFRVRSFRDTKSFENDADLTARDHRRIQHPLEGQASVCDFGMFQEVARLLRELHRAIEPGGRLIR